MRKGDGIRKDGTLFPVALAAIVIVVAIALLALSENTINPTTYSTTVNQSANQTTVAVDMSQEINNSADANLSVNQTMLIASYPSECALQLISPCDNNVPDQFICINQYYKNQISEEYNSTINREPHACPMYMEVGNISCGIEEGYCVVLHNQPTFQP